MSATHSLAVRQALATDSASPGMASPAPDLLLVCLQDPFAGIGQSSSIVRTSVPAADGNLAHQWMLEAVLEMNPPRFFESWATRGAFTLDLSVSATAQPATGTWGGSVSTLSGSGNCRVLVMLDAVGKVQFSLESDARHAPEMPMPVPDESRFLNADIAFQPTARAASAPLPWRSSPTSPGHASSAALPPQPKASPSMTSGGTTSPQGMAIRACLAPGRFW